MKYIGAHVSIEGGVSTAPLNANLIGAKAFALFTGNPSRWVTKQITDQEADLFKERCAEFGYTSEVILPHDNFLINLGSPDSKKLAMSRKSFLDEMKRCEKLGLKLLNFHPGSHLNLISVEECLDKIAESINISLDSTEGVVAVLETTAGQGSNLGWDFAHAGYIIDKVEDKDRVGVCVDTCHTYSAGYDLKSRDGYEKTWKEFDEKIGFKYLRGMHLNDDKRALGSRIDRHELIGRGTLGAEFFHRLMNDPRFDNIPLILETPNELIWEKEIEWLYKQIGEKEVTGDLPVIQY